MDCGPGGHPLGRCLFSPTSTARPPTPTTIPTLRMRSAARNPARRNRYSKQNCVRIVRTPKRRTGPKTARGKAYSRLKCSQRWTLDQANSVFRRQHTDQRRTPRPVGESAGKVWQRAEVRTDLLLEGLLVEWWRQRRALHIEIACLNNPFDQFSSLGSMANLQRYRTASQKAFFKTSNSLTSYHRPRRRLRKTSLKSSLLLLITENPHSPSEPSRGSIVVAADQGTPSAPIHPTTRRRAPRLYAQRRGGRRGLVGSGLW